MLRLARIKGAEDASNAVGLVFDPTEIESQVIEEGLDAVPPEVLQSYLERRKATKEMPKVPEEEKA